MLFWVFIMMLLYAYFDDLKHYKTRGLDSLALLLLEPENSKGAILLRYLPWLRAILYWENDKPFENVTLFALNAVLRKNNNTTTRTTNTKNSTEKRGKKQQKTKIEKKSRKWARVISRAIHVPSETPWPCTPAAEWFVTWPGRTARRRPGGMPNGGDDTAHRSQGQSRFLRDRPLVIILLSCSFFLGRPTTVFRGRPQFPHRNSRRPAAVDREIGSSVLLQR